MCYKTIPTNFHTHTIYCGHAVGLPLDYLDVIKTYGIKTLGFSEHSYINIPSFKHTIKTSEHMNMYYNDALKLRIKTNCEVLIGLEVDYFPSFMNYYKELHKKYDYLTLSVHFVIFNGLYSYGSRFASFEEMNLYCDYMESGMASGLFAFINHPDLFLNNNMNVYRLDERMRTLEDNIINNALKYDMPLELNVSQFKRHNDLYQPGFIRDDFWTIVGKTNAKVIINFDAHRPDEINLDSYNKIMEYAKSHNLNVITDFRKSNTYERN